MKRMKEEWIDTVTKEYRNKRKKSLTTAINNGKNEKENENKDMFVFTRHLHEDVTQGQFFSRLQLV